MTLLSADSRTKATPIAVGTYQPLPSDTIRAAVERAGRRVAPLWPLRSFVAVNPYLGLLDQPFDDAAILLAQRAAARMSAPHAFYAQLIRQGRISDADIRAALDQISPTSASSPRDVAAVKALALQETAEPVLIPLPTVADVAHTVTGVPWNDVVTESLSAWAGAHFDLGQASWQSPWADLPPYTAWRNEVLHDRSAEVRGVRGFRATIRRLPTTADETISAAVTTLQVPPDGLDAYLHRLLLTVHGWAGYARFQLWQAELYGATDATLRDLLAIRLAWEVALLHAFSHKGVTEAWHLRKHELSSNRLPDAVQPRLNLGLTLQRAFEHAYRRDLFARLRTASSIPTLKRPRAQVAFCIDVRSEVFRRGLETVATDVATIGFAGFFGFPIEYVPIGETQGAAQCPVLLTPQFVISETINGVADINSTMVAEERRLSQLLEKIWRSFKFGPISCFGFVGPVGLGYIKNLVMDSLGLGRPVPHPARFGLDANTCARLAPGIDVHPIGKRLAGMTPEQRLQSAEGGLRGMSLTTNFARIVLLIGHGSTTVNNPHASGLDCGACGGHSGEANARVAALILNDPAVRAGLRSRGIDIPVDTVFIAGLHDTTTDDLILFDRERIPASHRADLARLEADFAAAGRLARAERAALLKVNSGTRLHEAIRRRSTDWSQVRPEWGLAGCAAFIAAPRERTAGIDLQGRSFLHSYSWREDSGFAVLELIMVAPMVVASWINLQYYGSTVDNRVFGSGNKTLHNIVGTLGVLEGNSGDLRVGLPWQSVHDGEHYIHEPLRLHVLIEAPIDAMSAVIARHPSVRQLVDNGWIHLFALDDNGTPSHVYAGNLTWRSI